MDPIKTRNSSKFQQMWGESRTALNMWNNIGTLEKKDNFPKETSCLLCDNPMTQAEHLVNKAHGGNHTKHNVIPVCATHKKKGTDWKLHYTQEEQDIIILHTGADDEARLNPFIDENNAKFQDLRDLVETTVTKWREENGYA